MNGPASQGPMVAGPTPVSTTISRSAADQEATQLDRKPAGRVEELPAGLPVLLGGPGDGLGGGQAGGPVRDCDDVNVTYPHVRCSLSSAARGHPLRRDLQLEACTGSGGALVVMPVLSPR